MRTKLTKSLHRNNATYRDIKVHLRVPKLKRLFQRSRRRAKKIEHFSKIHACIEAGEGHFEHLL